MTFVVIGALRVNYCLLGNFDFFFCLLIFFKINFFEKFFQDYHQSIKQFGSRSGPTFWSGSKLFASYQQMTLVGQDLIKCQMIIQDIASHSISHWRKNIDTFKISNSLHTRYIPNFFFVVCLLFSKTFFFPKILSGVPSECQTVWIQIRPDILSGLIWVQTVCKRYQFAKDISYQTVWIQIRPDKTSGLILVQTVCKSYQLSNNLNPDQTYQNVRSELGSNCLQKLSVIKQFISRSELKFCQIWSRSKLFAKVFSRRH